MHRVTMMGETKSIGDWVAERGADRGIVLIRLTAGWDLKRALEEPLRKPTMKKQIQRGRKPSTPWLGVFKRSDKPGYRVTTGQRTESGSDYRLGTLRCDKEAAAIYNVWARNEHGMAAKVNLC